MHKPSPAWVWAEVAERGQLQLRPRHSFVRVKGATAEFAFLPNVQVAAAERGLGEVLEATHVRNHGRRGHVYLLKLASIPPHWEDCIVESADPNIPTMHWAQWQPPIRPNTRRVVNQRERLPVQTPPTASPPTATAPTPTAQAPTVRPPPGTATYVPTIVRITQGVQPHAEGEEDHVDDDVMADTTGEMAAQRPQDTQSPFQAPPRC